MRAEAKRFSERSAATTSSDAWSFHSLVVASHEFFVAPE
jgi:hypothetical protein